MNNDIDDPGWQELIKAFDLLDPPKIVEYEYRLYYNNDGNIYRTTNLKSDAIEEGNYVIVDESIHKNYMKYRIENGEPKLVPKNVGWVAPGLVRSEKGIAVVKNNASLPLSPDDEYKEVDHYEYRSNRYR